MISLFRSLTFFSSCSFGILLLSLLLTLRLPCPISLLESLAIITRYYCESYSTSRFNKFRIESFQYKDLKRLYCHHPALLPDNTYFEILLHIYCGFHFLALLLSFLAYFPRNGNGNEYKLEA